MTQQAEGEPEAVPALGIIMLNTRFPRVVGDIGNPKTFAFPVRYQIVEQATFDRVVRADGLSPSLVDGFVAAAHKLAAAGVAGLTTSCGFVAICQGELARRCPLPMVASSLCQVPLVQAALPAGRRVGVITIDARKLTPAHLTAAGAPADTPVVGTEGGSELTRVIEQDLLELDPDKACRDVLDAGEALVAKAPEVGAIVLECTNMAPYARALARNLGLPVFDILSLLEWWHRSLRPPVFGGSAR
jgi:Asp/Glu/Hydantoin racemase